MSEASDERRRRGAVSAWRKKNNMATKVQRTVGRGNPYHRPAGSPNSSGGEFTSAPGSAGGGADKVEAAARKGAGLHESVQVNDVVEFVNPQPDEIMPNGLSVRMRVLEVNGDRVLVEFDVPMGVKPTSVVSIYALRNVTTGQRGAPKNYPPGR